MKTYKTIKDAVNDGLEPQDVLAGVITGDVQIEEMRIAIEAESEAHLASIGSMVIASGCNELVKFGGRTYEVEPSSDGKRAIWRELK